MALKTFAQGSLCPKRQVAKTSAVAGTAAAIDNDTFEIVKNEVSHGGLDAAFILQPETGFTSERAEALRSQHDPGDCDCRSRSQQDEQRHVEAQVQAEVETGPEWL